MEENDEAMILTKFGKCALKPHYVIQALRIGDRIEVSGELLKAFPRQSVLADRYQALSCITTAIIDEMVVHDPAKPRSGFLDFDQLVEAGEDLGQHVLEQVFRFRFVTGQAK